MTKGQLKDDGVSGRPSRQVPPASLVFMLWSPLTSLNTSNGTAPQWYRGTAVRIKKKNVGRLEGYK